MCTLSCMYHHGDEEFEVLIGSRMQKLSKHCVLLEGFDHYPLETVCWHPLIFKAWVRLGSGLGLG